MKLFQFGYPQFPCIDLSLFFSCLFGTGALLEAKSRSQRTMFRLELKFYFHVVQPSFEDFEMVLYHICCQLLEIFQTSLQSSSDSIITSLCDLIDKFLFVDV